MSKLDETMAKFDKACEDESSAYTALAEAEGALATLQRNSASLLDQIGAASVEVDKAKAAMTEAAIGLRDQIDNAAYGRPNCRTEAWDEYNEARLHLGAAKLAQNALNESAENLIADTQVRERMIAEAERALTRACKHKLAVAEELRPLVASEVAGHTGKAMPKLAPVLDETHASASEL